MDIEKFYRDSSLRNRINNAEKKEYESIFCTVKFSTWDRKKASVSIEEKNKKIFYSSLEEKLISLEKSFHLIRLEKIYFGIRNNSDNEIPLEIRPVRNYLFREF